MAAENFRFFLEYGPYLIGAAMLLAMCGCLWLLIYLIKLANRPPR